MCESSAGYFIQQTLLDSSPKYLAHHISRRIYSSSGLYCDPCICVYLSICLWAWASTWFIYFFWQAHEGLFICKCAIDLFYLDLQEGSTSIIRVVSPGVNYVSQGNIQVVGGGGSGVLGTIQVDASGAIETVLISNHGSGFTMDPDIIFLFYNGTYVNMVSYFVEIFLFL